MKTPIFPAFAAAAAAQTTVGAWGQCGGIGYTGSTICASGYFCQYWNDYYYQCIPGEPSTTSGPGPSATTSTSPEPTSTGGQTCSGSFNKVSAEAYVEAINPGWNLGNTLDAVPDEGSWNNPPVQADTFAQVKAAGFKSVRIPVTYAYHYSDDTSPKYSIDLAWLDRVSDVVDMALDAGLYVLTNVHHDSWIWMDITSGADKDMIREKFYQTWYQIGTRLACKSSMVSFETINEPPSNTEEDAAFINELNEIFLKALEASGGFNVDRVVTLVGPGMDAAKTSQFFEPPAEIKNPWALQYHYYSPYDFIFSAWGRTYWGSDADYATMGDELTLVPGNFSVPLVIGEFEASQVNTEPAARWKWFDELTRIAAETGQALMLWDNGVDNLDRGTGMWRDPVAVEIMLSSVNGESDSLPDATVDPTATSQDTSAYVFHRAGDEVVDHELSFTLNGNSLAGIATASGAQLSEGSDYVASGSTVTLLASFLTPYFESTQPGVKETLTFDFSEGASPLVQIVVWDVPTFSSTSSAARAGAETRLSITTKGVDRVAAAKMVLADGTYMFDDWTVYLGPLQQARATWDGQFFYEDGFLYIRSSVADAAIAAGQDAILTFEFFPRTPGNNVTYTLTV